MLHATCCRMGCGLRIETRGGFFLSSSAPPLTARCDVCSVCAYVGLLGNGVGNQSGVV